MPRYDVVVDVRRLRLTVMASFVILGLAFGGYEIVRPHPSLNADTYRACKLLQTSNNGNGVSESAPVTPSDFRKIAKLGLKSNNVKIKDAAEEIAKATGVKLLLGTLALATDCDEVGLGLGKKG